MTSDEAVEVDGTVREALANGVFRVELSGGRTVRAHVPGKLRVNIVRVLPGDRVRVAMSPFDESRGRITRRYE
jgi:translation initiation factor IF-1